MASEIFNIAKGAFAEKCRDDATKFGMLLLKTAESDANLRDRATVAAILGANTEANFTNYARKTGITGTLNVDNANDRVEIQFGVQTFGAAGGGLNNVLAKAIWFYDEGGTDATRVPISHHDCVATTDGTDLVINPPATATQRAS